MTSMRVAYGDSNVLRCNLELAYDRFITNFNYEDTQKTVLNSSSGVVNSNDIVSLTDIRKGQGGLPLGATTRRQGGRYNPRNPYGTGSLNRGAEYVNPSTNYRNRRRGSGAR